MRAYLELSQEQLGLSNDDWSELVEFIDEIEPRIQKSRRHLDIESPPPEINWYQSSELAPKFNPHGWVGRYPGGVKVFPGKINRFEYDYLLQEIAGWLEIWDVPTAAAVMPLLYSGVEERRSYLLGYSQALIAFTEEAVANRPPVTVEREKEVNTQPRGPLDIQGTIQQRSQGTQQLSYNRLRFSFENTFNKLLVRFHTELARELELLAEESIILTPFLREHQRYHGQFIDSRLSKEILDASLTTDFTDPDVLTQARNQAPSSLVELVEIWESYLRDQALSLDFERQLTVGIKPIEKVYELWILKVVLNELEDTLGETPSTHNKSLDSFRFGSDVELFYNTSIPEFSRFLADELNSAPGRPDFALVVNDEVKWIGDAKFSPVENIQLEDYQRLLSYVVDLMQAGDSSTASILYASEADDPDDIRTPDYNISQIPLRPKVWRSQVGQLQSQLKLALDNYD